MKKSKGFIAAAVIITLSISMPSGCGSQTQSKTSSSTASVANQSQTKPDIKSIVKELVAAGKLKQDQADKIVAAFEKNPDAAPGPNSPLQSLVNDKTITEDQEHAVMDKLFGGQGSAGAQGGMQGGGLGASGSINTQGVTKKWTNVAYASKSSSEKLDIYLPNTGNGPFPVIVAIHGGGFKMGDKNTGEVNDMLTGLNKGYAVVCVNYRLSGEATFPAAVYDVKAAIRFIKANASKYNLNPNKIAAWGDSAGANLASLLGTSAGVSTLEDLSMGNSSQTSKVQAVVDFYGPINFLTMDDEFKASGKSSSATHNAANSFESLYMGAAITTIPDKVKQANPTTYISSNTVPFFMENGTADINVPTVQSENFAAALKKVIGKDKVTYIKLKGAGHGGSQFDTTDNLNKVFAFLDKYLK
jgi:acetyl esterase/lipase